MTITENLTWFVIVFFFIFGFFDLILRFINIYFNAIPNEKEKNNHHDKNKMFFDDETREALK